MNANAPIGIFDSGMGGLTVARAIKELLPQEDLIYFGDTAHLPYGDKSAEALKGYSKKITEFLLQKGCKVILIACNSASSAAFEEVVHFAGEKALVLDVINPVIRYAGDRFKNRNIGLIGTKRTITSNTYYLKLQEYAPTVHLKSLATPLFAPMIEEGFANSEISEKVIATYLSDRRTSDIEALILGCTHYPLIKSEIERFYAGDVEVIDASKIVAEELKSRLAQTNSLKAQAQGGEYAFYVSDYTASFESSTKVFFGEQVSINKIDIWNED